MWNQQLRELLNRFLTTKDPAPIENFFTEHTMVLSNEDATVDLSPEDLVSSNEAHSLSMSSLQSMHFDNLESESPGWVPNPERYRAEYELGKGGMASVWKMKDRHLLRSVALKRLHDHKAGYELERENFVVEAQVTSQLQHPGIVPIHDLQIHDNGDIYFTMREIKGQTFQKIIESVHRISEQRWETTLNGWNLRRLMGAMHSICQTLAYAHAKGVIHQDLKPTNIMVGEYGEILIVDWGIARIRSLYQANPNWVRIQASESYKEYKRESVAGTPQYMALEQFSDKSDTIDGRADIYALGVILFYILSKDKPFVGSVEEIIAAKKEPSPKLSSYFTDDDVLIIPTELIDICERAMAQNPADRFNDAKEMGDSIQSWLDGAKQEEAARQILEEIDLLKKDIHSHRHQIGDLLPQLEEETDTALPSTWWTHWTEFLDHRSQIGNIRDQIFQKAQGAIIYAPQLPEIYNRLIEVEYEDYLDAASEGNHRSMQKIERRIGLYLQHLPLSEHNRWRNIRTIDLQSIQSNYGQGINIERVHEQSHLLHLLEDKHWIGICGLAGVGKTHLAWQVASQWCKQHEWELIFCNLTDCINPSRVLQVIAKSLGIQQIGLNPIDVVVNVINRVHPKSNQHTESTIIIVDNIEGLNDESIDLLSTLLARCPMLRLISTSRKIFEHPQEENFILKPMTLVNSMELFTQHCKQRVSTWALTPNNKDLVYAIVQKLDRIPLAVELAGSRIAEFSLEEILNRLDQRFRILQSQDTQRPTLQMALSWSCSNLSLEEKHVLYQLSIFPRQFSLTLAERIIDYSGQAPLSDVLNQMTKHSLLTRENQSGVIVYTMLKSIREFSVQQSEDDVLESAYLRHAQYFSEYLKKHPNTDISLIQDNLLVASQHGEPKAAGRCCIALLQHTLEHGPMSTGLDIARDFLERVDIHANLRSQIELLEIDLLMKSGDSPSVLSILQNLSKRLPKIIPDSSPRTAKFQPSPFLGLTPIPLSQGVEEQRQQCLQHLYVGQLNEFYPIASTIFPHLSEAQQISLLHEAIQPHINAGQFSKALGLVEHLYSYTLEDTLRLDIQIDHSVILTRLGQHTQAIDNYMSTLKLAESMKDLEREARIIGNLGILHQAEGNLDKAIEKYTSAYAKFEALNHLDKLSALDGNLGTIYKEQDNLPQAMLHFDRAIEHAADLGNHIHHGVFLGNRAICLRDMKDIARAEKELRQAIDICDRHLEFAAGAFRSELALMVCRNGNPTDARALITKGESQVHEHKEQYGKFLCQKAEVMYLLHDYDACKDALREAEALCQHLMVRTSSALYKTLTETQQTIPAHIWLSAEEIEERSLVAHVNLQWGRYESGSSRYPQAMHYFNLAASLFKVLDDIEHLLQTQYSQAVVFSHNGEMNRAIQVATTVQKEHLVRGNHIKYASITNFLGGCYRRLGQLNKSLELHEESLRILEESDHIELAAALEKAALVCRILGEYERALNYMERALEYAIKNNMRVGTLYCNVGLCHNVMGNEEQALHYYHLGVQELRKIGDQNREMLYLGNIANIYMRQEKYVQAEAIFEDVIVRSAELGIVSNESINRGNYGEMLLQTGRWEEADFQLSRSIELAVEVYPVASGVFTGTLAKLRSLQERHEEAMALLEQEIVQTVKVDPEEYTKLLCVAAGIYFNASEKELALRTYEQATELLRAQNFQLNTDAYIKWMQTSELLGLPTQRSSDS